MSEGRVALLRVSGLAALLLALCAGPVYAQAPAETAAEGIPVQSPLVRAKCGSCHRSDDKMRMSRISYRRATPENWERTIKRMVTLNHVNLEPADARAILKYLADHQGPGAGRGAADSVRGRAADDRVHLRRRQGRRGQLLGVPHDRPRAERAPHQGGVGAAGRDAPRLLPAGRQPADERRAGLPPHARRRKPSRRPTAVRRTTAIRWKRCWSTSTKALSADDAGVDGVVGGDAAGAASPAGGRSSAQLPGKGAVYGQVAVTADASAPDSFTTRDALHLRAHRRDRDPHRQGAGLHRLPVARPRRGGRRVRRVWREVMMVERDWKRCRAAGSPAPTTKPAST